MGEIDDILESHPLTESSTFSWIRTSHKQCREAEYKLLETVLDVHYPAIGVRKESGSKIKVSIGWVKAGQDKYINTLCNNANSDKVLLITHGYGGGLGVYYKNYAQILSLQGWRVYSIDWMGMGNSSRPEWNLNKDLSEQESVFEAENFFIDALEDWRIATGISKMTILGHSYGGYLSACYALKYPERVEKLILASPVGVPKAPQDQESRLRNMKGVLVSLFVRGWKRGMTPFDLIRSFGPFGSMFFRSYTSRRFKHLEKQELELLHDYLYHISCQPGSGEYSLSAILHVGAWAKYSLQERIHTLNIPVSFIYGSHDWMDHNWALLVKNKEKDKVILLENSGHHLYIDQPELFNMAVLGELTDTRVQLKGVQYI